MNGKQCGNINQKASERLDNILEYIEQLEIKLKKYELETIPRLESELKILKKE